METKGIGGGLLQVGGKFGLYDVLRLLGRGGMGEVYLLRSPKDGEFYAAKIMFPPSGGVDGREAYEWRRRFANEALFAMKVTHRNLIRVYDAGEDPDSHLCYIIMDYMAGGTLSDKIRAKGRLPIDEAVKIAVRIATALEVAHRAGIVHRDIKPDNIMFDDDGEPRLADLGIAKFSAADSSMSMTKTEMIVGTPSYMAPEQMMDSHSVDARADIYSLGIVLYEMLTGSRPREGSTVIELLAKAVKGEELPNVCTMRPEVSVTIGYALSRMTASKPDSRPGTAIEAAMMLHDAYLGKLKTPKNILKPAIGLVRGGGDKNAIAKALIVLAVCALLGSGIIAIATVWSSRPVQSVEDFGAEPSAVVGPRVVSLTNEQSKTLYKTVVITNVIHETQSGAAGASNKSGKPAVKPPVKPKADESRPQMRERVPQNGKVKTAEANGIIWHYREMNGGAVLVSPDGGGLSSKPCISVSPKGNLMIPSKLGGLKVKGVGSFAFNKCDAIKSVSVPDGVEFLDDGAFNGCTALRRVSLPRTMESFGEAFSRCTNLETIEIDWYNPYFTPKKGLVYSKDMTTFVKFPPACRVKTITFPPEMTKIGAQAFADCTMGSFAVPNTIREIGRGAFARCALMKEISFTGSVDSIGEYAFGMSGLKTVALPNGIKDIASDTFRGCKELESVRLPMSLKKIDGNAIFDGCRLLRRVEFMGDAPTIGGNELLFPEEAEDLNIYVKRGTRGWNGPDSTDLPDKWPMGDANARPIYYMKGR